MASSKSYFAGANCRFLPTDRSIASDSLIFELDESDVWNSTVARSDSPELRMARGRISMNSTMLAASSERVGGPASLPVNVPDWSKILKDEYRENRRRESEEDYDEDDRVPPHEFLARQMERRRIASFSVHEGFGRTLKGRDHSRVRNAIWQRTGFED